MQTLRRSGTYRRSPSVAGLGCDRKRVLLFLIRSACCAGSWLVGWGFSCSVVMWLYLLGGQAVVRGVCLVCGTGDRRGARLQPLLVNRMRWLASFRRLHQLAGWVEWRPVACGRPVAAERGCMASATTRGHFCCLLRVPGVDDCWWHARRGVEELRHAALTIGRCLGGVDCWSRSSVLREVRF